MIIGEGNDTSMLNLYTELPGNDNLTLHFLPSRVLGNRWEKLSSIDKVGPTFLKRLKEIFVEIKVTLPN